MEQDSKNKKRINNRYKEKNKSSMFFCNSFRSTLPENGPPYDLPSVVYSMQLF